MGRLTSEQMKEIFDLMDEGYSVEKIAYKRYRFTRPVDPFDLNNFSEIENFLSFHVLDSGKKYQ